MGRTAGQRTVVLVTALLVLVNAASASAWCRSTTCRGAGCEVDADGCPSTGKPLWWGRRCVSFSMQHDGTRMMPMPAVREAVRKAFAAWGTVVCPGGAVSLQLGELQDTPCGQSEYDALGANVNVIVFRDDRWDFKGVDDNVAKTTVHFDANTGEILDADIEVNTAHNLFTVSDTIVNYDLQTVMTHEIGHFLGIAHGPEYGSVMYAAYEKGSLDGRKLTQDEIDAICTMYPPHRPGTCDLTPKGGLDLCQPVVAQTCAAGRTGKAYGAVLPLLLAVGGLLAWRVARRRTKRICAQSGASGTA